MNLKQAFEKGHFDIKMFIIKMKSYKMDEITFNNNVF